MTETKKAPAPPIQKAIDKAKELGTVKEETAEVLQKATTTAPDLGASTAEVSTLDVKLREEKENAELAVVKPAEIDHSGQIVFTTKHLELIKNQIAPNSTPEEFDLFVMMARRTRLDPLLKQLYFIKYGNGVPSYVTSIDSYRIIAHRTEAFAGVDLPIYDYDKAGKVTHCAITVYKFVQGQRVGFSAKVKFSEYSTGKNQWAGKPETMIAKVAEAHALRKAFPQDLNGVYTADEMDQAQEQGKPAQAPKPKMILNAQKQRLNELIELKGVDIEKLKAFVKEKFGQNSIGTLTMKQAGALISALEKKPDVEPEPEEEPVDITPEEEFADFVDSENEGTDDIINEAAEALG